MSVIQLVQPEAQPEVVILKIRRIRGWEWVPPTISITPPPPARPIALLAPEPRPANTEVDGKATWSSSVLLGVTLRQLSTEKTRVSDQQQSVCVAQAFPEKLEQQVLPRTLGIRRREDAGEKLGESDIAFPDTVLKGLGRDKAKVEDNSNGTRSTLG